MSQHHANPNQDEKRIEETAVEARQGHRDRPVWVVLVVSTALAAVILGILAFFFIGTSEAAALLG
jgi:fatty acid desaturase